MRNSSFFGDCVYPWIKTFVSKDLLKPVDLAGSVTRSDLPSVALKSQSNAPTKRGFQTYGDNSRNLTSFSVGILVFAMHCTPSLKSCHASLMASTFEESSDKINIKLYSQYSSVKQNLLSLSTLFNESNIVRMKLTFICSLLLQLGQKFCHLFLIFGIRYCHRWQISWNYKLLLLVPCYNLFHF